MRTAERCAPRFASGGVGDGDPRVCFRANVCRNRVDQYKSVRRRCRNRVERHAFAFGRTCDRNRVESVWGSGSLCKLGGAFRSMANAVIAGRLPALDAHGGTSGNQHACSLLIRMYPYITIVLNFSQMWALYCLVQFYHVTHERLKPIRPLAKFISFKAIVFATWWQSVGIALLCSLGVLSDEEKIQTGLQDFLICIEMAIAAVAHVYVFSAEPYQSTPISEYGKITTETERMTVKVGQGKECKPATTIAKQEREMKSPKTSITESVVEDVKLTINQAIEPVEKGVTLIQESIQQRVATDTDDG
ncbi:LAZ1 homolog 2-like protein [Drosera capensis]